MNDRLYRSRTDRVISGVAGGLADRLALDPSLVRVLWVVLAVASGGLFAVIYFVMMIVVPEAPYDLPPRTPGGFDPWSSPAATGIRPSPAPEETNPDTDSDTARLTMPGQPGAPVAPVAPLAAQDTTAAEAASGTSPAGSGTPASWLGPDGQRVDRTTTPHAWVEPAARHDDRGGPLVLGLILVLIGGFFLIRQYAPDVDLGLVWPIAAVAVGALLVMLAFLPDRARR
jgi:phage shock protein PspC (stress-responsive transcriptional regulator)